MSSSRISIVIYPSVVRDSVPDVLQSFQHGHLPLCSQIFRGRCPTVESTLAPTMV
ncbi:hypothetical protein DPMN_159496 [Dreissena polymorpha]|uniref:Uncharacterized protein n=1 Tax=Dreissena polymorpha TaxID=45954 RepID=A0A9D4IQS0_DREPO|nr:hypothetical protein DPMN_159496 [Dreissena polymorpha]